MRAASRHPSRIRLPSASNRECTVIVTDTDGAWRMADVIWIDGGARQPQDSDVVIHGGPDVDTGVINWVNADFVTHIVPRRLRPLLVRELGQIRSRNADSSSAREKPSDNQLQLQMNGGADFCSGTGTRLALKSHQKVLRCFTYACHQKGQLIHALATVKAEREFLTAGPLRSCFPCMSVWSMPLPGPLDGA